MSRNVRWLKTYFILSIICCLSLSCAKKNVIEVTDVKKAFKDEFVVDQDIRYTQYKIEVKGFVDDTIIINDRFKLSNEIDTTFRLDYYGGDKTVTLKYDPYKAKKGTLKIVHYAN